MHSNKSPARVENKMHAERLSRGIGGGRKCWLTPNPLNPLRFLRRADQSLVQTEIRETKAMCIKVELLDGEFVQRHVLIKGFDDPVAMAPQLI